MLPGLEDRPDGVRAGRASSAATTIVLPDPGYPDYRSAVALAARAARAAAAPRTTVGPTGTRRRAKRAAALYLNYPVEPRRGVCARRRVRGGDRVGGASTARGCMHDFAYGDLVFDGRKPRASSRSKARARSASSSSRCRSPTAWRAGGSASRSETPRSSRGSRICRTTSSPASSCPCRRRASPRSRARRNRSRSAARSTSGAAIARSRRSQDIDARSEGTFFVWFRLPDGLTRERLLEEHRVAVAPGEGFGERGRGWARLSLATADDKLDLRARASRERVRGLTPRTRGLTPLF